MREYLNYTRFARIVALISCEHRCENHYVVGVSTKKSSFNGVVLIGLGVCTIHVHNTRSRSFLCDDADKSNTCKLPEIRSAQNCAGENVTSSTIATVAFVFGQHYAGNFLFFCTHYTRAFDLV